MATRPMIFGTAGHIDHGKTTLVRSLTGVNTDRLPEEKSRGISIDLGFAEFILPSGQHAAFIDVPGHERFIRNMVSGVHGMDAVILVVAADEGVMPQTQEHLDILSILGVQRGITVLTKSDLVDEDWLTLVEETTRETLQGTFLATQPILAVDALSGRGLKQLQQAMAKIAEDLPTKSVAGPTRLPIDRVFSVKGFGTVVTGTLVQGSISVEQSLELVPTHVPVRVRGVEVHGHRMDVAHAGQRVALNLANVDKEQIVRGQVLASPGLVPEVTSLVVEIQMLASSKESLDERTRVHCHLGTSEVLARIYFYDRSTLEPGDRAFAELRCESPIAALRSDRFLIRSYSPMATIGGGVVLEPGGHHRRREANLIERLRQWVSGDLTLILTDILNHSEAPLSLEELLDRMGGSREQSDELVARLEPLTHGDVVAGYYVGQSAWDSAVTRLHAYLRQYHRNHSLLPGVPRERLKSELFDAWANRALIWFLNQIPEVQIDREWVRLKDFVAGPRSPDEQGRLDRLRAIWEESDLRPLDLENIRQAAAIVDAEWFYDAVHYLAQGETIVRLEEGVYIAATALDRATEAVTLALRARGELSTGDLRNVLDTNRRFAVLILELLDSRRITRRLGDKRGLVS